MVIYIERMITHVGQSKNKREKWESKGNVKWSGKILEKIGKTVLR